MSKILEMASKSKGGRKRIVMVLHKIHEDAAETNRNGIHWDEQCVRNNIDSVKGIPICAEFMDDTKEVPLGHGYTSIKNIDGKSEPVFENSECVGMIEYGEIRTIDINGETIKALVGTGYLYSQRFPKFVAWVKKNTLLSNVDSSIEIVGREENDNHIVYVEENPSDDFRTPRLYDYSGTAILSIRPADENAIILEVSSKKPSKEENIKMDEKELKEIIRGVITETNSKNDELNAKISELNSQLTEKDRTITELNATIEKLNKAIEDCKQDKEGNQAKMEALQKELGELKAQTRLNELESAIETFSEEEKEYAKSEINSFKENPMDGSVDSIVSKIYAGIGQASKKAAEEARVAEQNAARENETIDIFSEVNSDTSVESEDTNIF